MIPLSLPAAVVHLISKLTATVAPTKPTVEVMAWVRFVIESNAIRVEATSEATSLVLEIPHAGLESCGSFLIHASDLRRLSAVTQGAPLRLLVKADQAKTSWSCGKRRGTIAVRSDVMWPEIERPAEGVGFGMNASMLADRIGRVAWAIGRKQDGRGLDILSVTTRGAEVTLRATNGYVLAVARTHVGGDLGEGSSVISDLSVRHLQGMLAEMADEVLVSLTGDGGLLIRKAGTFDGIGLTVTMVAHARDRAFPQIDAFYAETPKVILESDRANLAAAVTDITKVVGIGDAEKGLQQRSRGALSIRIALNPPDSLSVDAVGMSASKGDASCVVDAKAQVVDGLAKSVNPGAIGLQAGFLRDALTNLPGTTARLSQIAGGNVRFDGLDSDGQVIGWAHAFATQLRLNRGAA